MLTNITWPSYSVAGSRRCKVCFLHTIQYFSATERHFVTFWLTKKPKYKNHSTEQQMWCCYTCHIRRKYTYIHVHKLHRESKRVTILSPVSLPNVDRFSKNYFPGRLSSKFNLKQSLTISSHLKRVATLPCNWSLIASTFRPLLVFWRQHCTRHREINSFGWYTNTSKKIHKSQPKLGLNFGFMFM